MEQLFKLHTYAAIPSVLLIEDLDDYFDNEAPGNDSSLHIARICAMILHSMNSCSRILKKNVRKPLYVVSYDNKNKFLLFLVEKSVFSVSLSKIHTFYTFREPQSQKLSFSSVGNLFLML